MIIFITFIHIFMNLYILCFLNSKKDDFYMSQDRKKRTQGVKPVVKFDRLHNINKAGPLLKNSPNGSDRR